ncbi:hypothetical protein JTB14_028257 [Gonioctena quinquepunctata]|nr:hypothetical protein JTB14_028257 [Gonioctena quinquepunctata]
MCLPPVRVEKLSRRRINNVVTPYETVKRRQTGDPEVLEIRARHRQIAELGPANNGESLFLREFLEENNILFHLTSENEKRIFVAEPIREDMSKTAVRSEVELPAKPRKRRQRCRMADNIEVVPENACTSLRHDVNPDVTPVNPFVAQEIVDSSPDEEPRRWRRKVRLVKVNSPPERTAKSALTEEGVHVMDADS